MTWRKSDSRVHEIRASRLIAKPNGRFCSPSPTNMKTVLAPSRFALSTNPLLGVPQYVASRRCLGQGAFSPLRAIEVGFVRDLKQSGDL